MASSSVLKLAEACIRSCRATVVQRLVWNWVDSAIVVVMAFVVATLVILEMVQQLCYGLV